MVYNGTYTAEVITFHTAGIYEDMYCIELQKHCDESMFRVSCCCDPTWVYEFDMSTPSDYERVKFNIMEQVFECDDVYELLNVLDEMFKDGFADILVEDECDCDGNCEHCNCKE